jgi:hypothetical protein
MSQEPKHPDLLVGGRAISMFLFGTEEKAKAIYPLREGLASSISGERCGTTGKASAAHRSEGGNSTGRAARARAESAA